MGRQRIHSVASHGIDYDLTYAPVSRMSTLSTILSMVVRFNLKIHQMDVTTAVLSAALTD